jgi:hypothetical protein
VEWRSLGPIELHGVQYPVDIVEIQGIRVAPHTGEAGSESALDVVLAQVADDPAFRAVLMTRPDDALRPHALSQDERALLVDIAGLLGYPLLAMIPGAGLVRLIRLARLERFAPGTLILRQQDVASRVYLVNRGEVAVYQADADGRQGHVESISRGGHFGERGALLGLPRNADVRAATDVELFSLDVQDLQELGQVAPGFVAYLREQSTLRRGAAATPVESPIS